MCTGLASLKHMLAVGLQQDDTRVQEAQQWTLPRCQDCSAPWSLFAEKQRRCLKVLHAKSKLSKVSFRLSCRKEELENLHTSKRVDEIVHRSYTSWVQQLEQVSSRAVQAIVLQAFKTGIWVQPGAGQGQVQVESVWQQPVNLKFQFKVKYWGGHLRSSLRQHQADCSLKVQNHPLVMS